MRKITLPSLASNTICFRPYVPSIMSIGKDSAPPRSGETSRLRSNEPGSPNGRVPEAGVDGWCLYAPDFRRAAGLPKSM
jgi:hypothetical protein